MPLITGKSKESFGKNVETEMNAGKPQKQSLAIAYSMKRKAQQKMAMGGALESGYSELPTEHELMNHAGNSLVDRIMAKRQNMMAEGGVVADEGEADEPADHEANDFDYLSTGDLDDSTTNSGSADGDQLGNSQEDEDQRDMVARIMKSRSLKDRMPRPA